jgi:hypothetical protein
METLNFSSHVCCFYDFVSVSNMKCSSFVLSVQWAGVVLLLILLLRPGLLQPTSASILFRRCLDVSSISVWVHSPFYSYAKAAAAAGSGEFAPPFVWSLHMFSARFLCYEFARSALVLSAGLPCCEPQVTPVSSGRLNRFWFDGRLKCFWFDFPLCSSVSISLVRVRSIGSCALRWSVVLQAPGGSVSRRATTDNPLWPLSDRFDHAPSTAPPCTTSVHPEPSTTNTGCHPHRCSPPADHTLPLSSFFWWALPSCRPKMGPPPCRLAPRTLPATPCRRAPPESSRDITSAVVAERLPCLTEMGHQPKWLGRLAEQAVPCRGLSPSAQCTFSIIFRFLLN